MEKLLQLCQKHQITLNQIMLLQHIKQKIRAGNVVPAQNTEALTLIKKGYLSTDYQLLPQAVKILTEANKLFKRAAKDKSYYNNDEFNKNVEAFRHIFPPVRAGGNQVARASFATIKDKLIEFFDRHPEWEGKWDVILEATAKYVQSFEETGFSRMTTSKYFILKDNDSQLANECEKLLSDDYQEKERLTYYKVL